MPTMSDDRGDGFFARWSRRKAEVRRGAPTDEPAPPPAAATPSAPAAAAEPARPEATAPLAAPSDAPVTAPPPPPLPTMDDVRLLTRGSDFSPFVRAGVDEGVKRAALKKLFADPHFNVMDGLDVYIDDYGRPDPLPASMLRKLAQSKALGLFPDETPPAPAATAPAAAPDAVDAPVAADALPATDPDPALQALAEAPNDEDADLRLQRLDAAGREGDPRNTGEDAGRER